MPTTGITKYTNDYAFSIINIFLFVRNRSPDYIYCGKCHNLVGKSSNLAPHQVDNLTPHPAGQRLQVPQLLAGGLIVEHPTGGGRKWQIFCLF